MNQESKSEQNAAKRTKKYRASNKTGEEIRPVNPKLNIQKINPEYSLEGLMLKLKLQHFGLLM